VKNKISALILPIVLAMPLYGGPGCSVPQNDGGIYKTTDAGKNWEQTIAIEGDDKNNLSKADTEQLLIDPNNPNVVFLVTKSNGLYVSNQFGASWRRIIPETDTVYSIEADPRINGLFYASILLNDRAKIVKSENGGQDWKEVYTEAGKGNYVTQIRVDPFFENNLIAANSEGLLVRSSNGGNTWQATFPFQDSVIDLAFDSEKENSIWALTTKGVWHSQDGGLGFDLLSLDPSGEMGSSFYLLRKNKDGLFLATDKGFYLSRDEGNTWRKIITLNNPADFPARDFVALPGNNGGNPSSAKAVAGKWAMGAGMTLYLTMDGGENWKPIQFEIDRMVNAIAVKPDNPNQILVGVETVKRGAFGLGR